MPQILRHYLTKEGRVRKVFNCLIRIKEPCVRKFEGITRSKILGILQTVLLLHYRAVTPQFWQPFTVSMPCTSSKRKHVLGCSSAIMKISVLGKGCMESIYL